MGTSLEPFSGHSVRLATCSKTIRLLSLLHGFWPMADSSLRWYVRELADPILEFMSVHVMVSRVVYQSLLSVACVCNVLCTRKNVIKYKMNKWGPNYRPRLSLPQGPAWLLGSPCTIHHWLIISLHSLISAFFLVGSLFGTNQPVIRAQLAYGSFLILSHYCDSKYEQTISPCW